jgi:hypothetical protein
VAAGVLALAGTAGAAESPAGWGTVKGRVTYNGQAPAPVKINVDKDQAHCLSKGDIYSEEWVVNPKNNGVKWAFVWLEPVPDPANPAKKQKMPINPALKEIKDKDIVLDQPCCKFEPHAFAMRQGQVLIAKNSAPIAHNVNWTGGAKNPGNNVIVPPGQEVKIDDLVASPFPVSVSCNIHGWMKGWVRIFDHPYYAVTDEDGNYEIKGAPAGEYMLVVWHEGAGWAEMKTEEVNGKKVRIHGHPITIKPDTVNDQGNLGIKQP